jgi:hypothetical protein
LNDSSPLAHRAATRPYSAAEYKVIEGAASAFIDARIDLDQALTGPNKVVDSVALYRPLARHESHLARSRR